MGVFGLKPYAPNRDTISNMPPCSLRISILFESARSSSNTFLDYTTHKYIIYTCIYIYIYIKIKMNQYKKFV